VQTIVMKLTGGQVSVRWCRVINEDKRLWKDLLWRDFGWRKSTGKGRAKKARQVEAGGYDKLYGQLFHARQVAARKKAKRERLHADRVARTAVLLPEVPLCQCRTLSHAHTLTDLCEIIVCVRRQLVPLLCGKLRKPEACGKDHPWRVCSHPAPRCTLPPSPST
jgi:hypothetical protein